MLVFLFFELYFYEVASKTKKSNNLRGGQLVCNSRLQGLLNASKFGTILKLIMKAINTSLYETKYLHINNINLG